MNKYVVMGLVALFAFALPVLSLAGSAAGEKEKALSIKDQVVQEKCTLCHSSKRIFTADPEALKATLERMQKMNPDWITDVDNDHIAKALMKLLANPSIIAMRKAWQETVQRGEGLFKDPGLGGSKGLNCRACHNPPYSLKGVHDAYPQFDSTLKRFITLEDRVNQMIVAKMEGQTIPRQDPRMTDLVAYLKSLK